jgi:hypothetical protein
VSPVKYELGFYIPEDDILHSHCREHLKSYLAHSICAVRAKLTVILLLAASWLTRSFPSPSGSQFGVTPPRRVFAPSYPVSYALAEAENSVSRDITNYTYILKDKMGLSTFGMYTTLASLKNAVFWDVTPCGSCKNRRFLGTYRLHQVHKNQRARNSIPPKRRLLQQPGGVTSQNTALFIVSAVKTSNLT